MRPWIRAPEPATTVTSSTSAASASARAGSSHPLPRPRPPMNELSRADAEARERALDPQRSILLQAPAGSGKTSMLTQRFLRLLCTVDDPGEILAITFTRKAAAEMRARVTQALRGEIAADDPCAAQLHALTAAALRHGTRRGWNLAHDPGALRIQTIDSFTYWLASQLPIAARAGGTVSGTGRCQLIADDVGETRVDARAQLPRPGLEHVAQPVSPLLQHVCEQPLDVVPMVVETLEQQLRVCAEHGIGLRGQQRAARRTAIQLLRRLGDPQRAAGPGGDGQLAREPIGERVDGLNPQRARVLREIPAARRAMAQRRRGERVQLRGARVIGCDLPAQSLCHAGAHLGRGLAREGDGENLARLVHRA